MVSLPFIAGALVAGGWANLRTLVAALGVMSVFLLRTPLVAWRRSRTAGSVQGQDRELRKARFSLVVYGSVAAVAGFILLLSLPPLPLLVLGGGAALLTGASVLLSARNQRDPVLQIASAIGLTASSLAAYLAVRGHLEAMAFLIWALCAAHSAASVLVVHARLEWIVASRSPSPPPSPSLSPLLPLPHRRNALLAQAGLWLFLGALAVSGRPWVLLPFLPPSSLHWWELWQMRSGTRRRVSMHRIGWMQLGASAAFCFLLIAVLR